MPCYCYAGFIYMTLTVKSSVAWTEKSAEINESGIFLLTSIAICSHNSSCSSLVGIITKFHETMKPTINIASLTAFDLINKYFLPC